MIDNNKRTISSLFSAKGSLDDLRRRILFLILALLVFRIGSFIPIPGINTSILMQLLEEQKGTIIEMFNMFSGGALSRASIFALGIMPYISSSIIVQLLITVHPMFAELKKDGEDGRRKINRYIRYGTLVLGLFQSIGISIGLPNMPNMHGLIVSSEVSFYLIAIFSLLCGTIFLMWLGEQITHKGIGNGISIIIFTGIVSELPSALGHTIEKIKNGELSVFLLLITVMIIFIATFFVVFIERSQRRIIVSYAQHQRGRRIYSLQNTHLPLKINMAGVIPAIFASSVILFPATLASWFGGKSNFHWLVIISTYLQPGHLLYILFYAIAIVFFCFFYTSLVFNPTETADNLKRSGAFISGMRPGLQTAKYINKITIRLTVFGATYITCICLMPELMRVGMNVPFYFGGTSLLIVVVVTMDFINQVQTLMMSSQYDSILKKANLKGF